MGWTWLADFFGGVFLANAVPHFVNGISGRRFPTPFATPPGRGESSPTVNVLWGSLNAALAWVLLWNLGDFDLHRVGRVLVAMVGGLALALMLSRAFGSRQGGSPAAS